MILGYMAPFQMRGTKKMTTPVLARGSRFKRDRVVLRYRRRVDQVRFRQKRGNRMIERVSYRQEPAIG